MNVNNKNDKTRNFVTLTLRNLADKVDFFFNPNILKNFLLGVGGFVFPNGDQKVPLNSRISVKIPGYSRTLGIRTPRP